MYEQWDTSVPRKHHANYRYRANCGTTNTRNIHTLVYSVRGCSDGYLSRRIICFLFLFGKVMKYRLDVDPTSQGVCIGTSDRSVVILQIHLTFSLPYMTEISVVIRQ